MLFEWLGRKRNDERAVKSARLIEAAVEKVIAEARYLTGDLGGKSGTREMGDAIVSAM
jgi:3-isopropylmalate dehydrogenase